MGLKYPTDEHCDWDGKCKRKPFAEVYPVGKGWSYLCRFHFILAMLKGHKQRWWGWYKVEKDEHDNV